MEVTAAECTATYTGARASQRNQRYIVASAPASPDAKGDRLQPGHRFRYLSGKYEQHPHRHRGQNWPRFWRTRREMVELPPPQSLAEGRAEAPLL